MRFEINEFQFVKQTKKGGSSYELPQIVRTAQKKSPKVEKQILSNELTSLFEWCQFCFELDTVPRER